MSRTSSLLPEMPFRLQVAPAEAVEHRAWRHARLAVLDALERDMPAVVLGPAGSGKTLLLRAIGHSLEALGWRVAFVGAEGLDTAPAEAEVLLLDEAAGLSEAELAALAGQDRPFVLAALPGFAPRLAGMPRGTERVTLGPMAPDEVARLVSARLAAAGRPRDLFRPEALRELARHSRGLVRLVLVLAGAALFAAESEGAAQVSAGHVEEAATMRTGGLEPEEPDEPMETDAPVQAAETPPVPVAVPRAVPTRERLAGRVPVRARVSRARMWLRRMTLGLAATGLALAAGAVALAPPAALRRIWGGAPSAERAETPMPASPAPAPPPASLAEARPEPRRPEPVAPMEPPVEAPVQEEAAVPVPAPERPAPRPAPSAAPASRIPPARPRVAAVPETAPVPAPAPLRPAPMPETAAEVPPSPWWVDRPPPVRQERSDVVRVVMREPANIRSAPGLASAVVRVTSAGMVLRVFGQRGPWVQVGDSAPWGWVHAAVVERAS